MSDVQEHELALLGGPPLWTRPWPKWPSYDDQTEAALTAVLRSGRWTLSGAYKGEPSRERQFAKAFAKFCGTEYCTPTTSGTAALTLALQALDIGPQDEVLVPGLTWVACASATLNVGAVPVLVDIELPTLAMCPKKTRAAITRKTRAIMLVHPFCRNADLNEFLKISNETGIPIVEDCSQAHGAKWNGARVGSLGVMGCFSMQQSKVLTSGEGGAVITNRADLYRKLEQLRADGRIFSEAPEFGRLELIEVGEVQGQNFCLSEFQSALLLDRLPHLDEQNARRHEFSKRLCARLEDEGLAKSLPPNDERHQNAYYNLVLEPDLEKFQGCSIDAIAQALTAELCVQISPIYRPMNQHRLYCPLRSPKVRSESQKADVSPTRFALPEAQRARAKFLTLPNWMLLSDDSGIEAIAAAFAKVSSLKEKLMSSDQPETAAAF